MSRLNNKKLLQLADKCRNDGNNSAKYRRFGCALEYYNKSLCYIDQEKESLALTYAERSAICFECDEFESCLRNIQLALDHKYPSNEIAILNERRSECLRILESKLNHIIGSF